MREISENDQETASVSDDEIASQHAESRSFWNEAAEAPEAPERLHGGPAIDRPVWREHPLNLEKSRYVPDQALGQRVDKVSADRGPLAAAIEVNGRDATATDRGYNCGECARAVALTLDGTPTAADALQPTIDSFGVRREGEGRSSMESWLDQPFPPTIDPAVGYPALEHEAAAWPDGAHAIVNVEWKTARETIVESGESWDDYLAEIEREQGIDARETAEQTADVISGHYFNVAKLDGQLLIIDGQPGNVDRYRGPMTDEYREDTRAITWLRSDRKASR